MKKLLIGVTTAAFCFLTAFTVNDPLPIGASLPMQDLQLKEVSGKMLTLKDAMQENGLLVMFSCNTCPYVIKNQERTIEICKYARANKIGVILLNANEGQRDDEDSYAAMQAYAKQQGYTFHYAVDAQSTLADAFGAKRTPECYLFSKADKLVYHGAIDDNPADAGSVNRKHLKTAIDEMISGKDIAIKETRSVGCSIKRH